MLSRVLLLTLPLCVCVLCVCQIVFDMFVLCEATLICLFFFFLFSSLYQYTMYVL